MDRRNTWRFAAALLALQAGHAATAMADAVTPDAPGIEMADLAPQPALDRLRAAGATTVYLGLDGGRRTYMATSADGHANQLLYVDPQSGAATFGESFDAAGSSNAVKQVSRSIQRHEAILAGQIPDAPLDLGVDPTPAPVALAAGEPPREAAPTEDPQTGPRRLPQDLGMDKATFLANVANTLTTFPVGKPGTPKLYLMTSPSCEPCHAAWDGLRGLVTQGKATVVVILAAPTKPEEPLAAAVLSQKGTSLAWYSGVGSTSDQSLVPPPPAPGTEARKQVDQYVRMNTMFARDAGATRLPALAYEDGDGNWHMEANPDVAAVRGAIAKRTVARSRLRD